MALRKPRTTPNRKPKQYGFPVVGIGASAGGLEAVGTLLRSLPADPEMAFIVLIHSGYRKVSDVDHILARSTPMRVTVIDGSQHIESNCVYVAPPGTEVSIEGGQLTAIRAAKNSDGLPIDDFFRMLAEDQGRRAIGVVLSGALSDGTAGIRAIKAEGGITFAQDDSAQFSGMPQSAVDGGSVDFIMSPAEIAGELSRIGQHAYLRRPDEEGELPAKHLASLFNALRLRYDVDFTEYKPATVERRIRRRMVMQRVEKLEDYVGVIQQDPVELGHLYEDILIRVTSFFRDPEVFETLERVLGPALIKDRDQERPVRVWVPGCATGEEAYSVAIALLEASSGAGLSCPFQVFATDVSESAIERARQGLYPGDIVAEVSVERLQRYFTKTETGYRVSKVVRDCVVFARQNVTKDPPFSRLDLITCRNLMIYLGPTLQRRVMSIFHYALRSDGYLLLGSSESIGSFSDLFKVVDRKHKLYQKRPVPVRIPAPFEITAPADRAEAAPVRHEEESSRLPGNVFREADRVLLGRFTPPGVLIDDRMEIVQFRGRTSAFLEPAPGQATFNILKMAREGLLGDLRAAIQLTRKSEAPVSRRGIRMKSDGHWKLVDIEVIPFLTAARERYQLVVFEEQPPEPVTAPGGSAIADAAPDRESARLARELEATREYLQSIIEEQEAMNEELRSANEEIQSSNEELQSTNEELETAKEELQSSNEELTTLNEELEVSNIELADANNDLVNLLASIDIAIVMLDSSLRIRRFNPVAQRILNLIPSDAGRPISDLNLSLVVDDLETMLAGVIEHLEVREMEVSDRGGRRYRLRVRPYKTTENRIEGAVMVLVDLGTTVGK